jgi:hypothetical protein
VHTVLEPLSVGHEILCGDKEFCKYAVFVVEVFQENKNTTVMAQNILVW